MPMYRGVFGQAVGHVDPHPLALDRLDRGARGLAVVAPEPRDHAISHNALDRFSDEVEFLDVTVHSIGQ